MIIPMKETTIGCGHMHITTLSFTMLFTGLRKSLFNITEYHLFVSPRADPQLADFPWEKKCASVAFYLLCFFLQVLPSVLFF